MLYESPTFRLLADDQVFTLWLDFRGRGSNRFTLPVLSELSLVLDRIAELPTPEVLLIRSSRPESFLEEFDSRELSRFRSALEFAALVRRGQEVARKLARLRMPTVAVIEGRCAGGGLDLALACDYRFGVEGFATRFESVEVSRGLIPAWGGTRRLLRLIGMTAALQLMSGDVFTSNRAFQTGLLDRLVAPHELNISLMSFVDALRDRPHRPLRSRIASIVRAGYLSLVGPRQLRRSESRLETEAVEEPTALRELYRAIAAGLASEGEGLAAERSAVSRLSGTASTNRLLTLHRTRTTNAVPATVTQPLPRRIGIVGGGDHGSQLACLLANRGHEVVLQERNQDEATRASRRIAEQVSRGQMSSIEATTTVAKIKTTSEWVGFDNADFVLEASVEDPGVKRNIFNELERRVRPRVILATTSTTVLVDSVQAESLRPGRIVGLHFPNLMEMSPIAEVIAAGFTDASTTEATSALVAQWGFLPLRVADRPGRLVTLVRLAYLSEGVLLVSEGLPIHHVDVACKRFGMKYGPLEWCDRIGLDRLAELTSQMQLARGDSFARNLLFQRMLSYGLVGEGNQEGFYRHGRTQRPSEIARTLLWQDLDQDCLAPYIFDPAAALRDGVERIVLRTVNEAADALADEPDSDPSIVDLALTLGMGWAAHRGGPLRYADDCGLSQIVDRLAYFAERFGPRFAPCDELIRRAEAGESFYGEPGSVPAEKSFTYRIAG
jgi:3-hydroxyacyl-CoA dehydrogenase/enoyl-CoA hydratase/3-hydroxybutyryl-CoA epimerase